MSQENQSYLRFSLEESVWFQKGQEVSELISISLDPNITIVENDQYVAIRGSLELTGEYKRFDEDEFEKEEDISAPKFVQSVEEREEGVCEFLHRFPVDITIPNNRIQSVYDIDVTVDSFDYLIPERSCLKLAADLTISGLYGEQQNVPVEEEEERGQEENNIEQEAAIEEDEALRIDEEQSDVEELIPKLETNYRYDQYEEDEEEEEDFIPRKPDVNFILTNPVQSIDTENDEDDYEPFTAEAKKQQEPAETAEVQPWGKQFSRPSVSESQVIPGADEKEPEFSVQQIRDGENESPSFVEQDQDSKHSVPESHSQEEVAQESSSSSSSPEPQVQKKKKSSKKSMSIAEFLGRKTENEDQVKLKVCIVQNGETLDKLSDRYEVSIQQILRVNHLEASQDVYEGQVLYIPVGADSKIANSK